MRDGLADSILLLLIMFMLSLLIDSCRADSIHRIVCKYAHGMKSISVATAGTTNTLHKILRLKGKNYEIHIDSVGSYSEITDYIVIEDGSGYKITYALECE